MNGNITALKCWPRKQDKEVSEILLSTGSTRRELATSDRVSVQRRNFVLHTLVHAFQADGGALHHATNRSQPGQMRIPYLRGTGSGPDHHADEIPVKPVALGDAFGITLHSLCFGPLKGSIHPSASPGALRMTGLNKQRHYQT